MMFVNERGGDPLFRSRQLEAIAWCSERLRTNDPAGSLRTASLKVEADAPRELFAARVVGGFSPYDVSADGQRFLLAEQSEAQGGVAPLTVVLNWQKGLK